MSNISLFNQTRRPVSSLAPYLRIPLQNGSLIDPNRLDPAVRQGYPWIGWGIGKGVTHLRKDISVFAVPKEQQSGLHSHLVQGLENVDPPELCYKPNHIHGFGGFIRWIYLSCPTDASQDVIGVDWGIGPRPTSGITTSVLSVAVLCRNILHHGISPTTRVALLDPNLSEITFNREMIETHQLFTIQDWARSESTAFCVESKFCPRCGLRTFKNRQHRFCYRCGANPQTVRKEVYDDQPHEKRQSGLSQYSRSVRLAA